MESRQSASTKRSYNNPIRAVTPYDLIRSIAGGALPNILIFCVPVWAIILKIFFPKRLYIEHIVFALHVHIFAVFVLGVRMVISDGLGFKNPLTVLIPWVYLPIYNFFAGQRFYREHPVATLVKGAGISCGYGCILGFAAVLGVVVTLIGALMNL